MTNNNETIKITWVATRAQKELDIAKAEAKFLSKVLSGLQRRLERLEGRGTDGSDLLPLEWGSDDD